ncbi:MAG: winged helix-turn-helix domain-containing protein [Candidatus Thorarchaeota archaeon]
MIEVSQEQAQRFILDVQGLRTEKPSRTILKVAKRIHNIQIDTISVVTRSHDLTTFCRLPSYKEGEVWALERRGKLFEFWSHAMCLVPMEAFPFYAWKMEQLGKQTTGWKVEWGAKNKDIVEEVYRHVKKNGPTQSASLGTRKKGSNGWWDWKVEKRALEHLFTVGRLMVAYRKGFQKYYDLTERVLPSSQDSEPMTDEQAANYVVQTTLGSLGLASYEDIKVYLGRMPARVLWKSSRTAVEGYLDSLRQDGVLEEVSIAGLGNRYFVLGKKHDALVDSAEKQPDNDAALILSPFDNVMRERHRPRKIWGFEYKLEAYTPAAERVSGYYVLPILDGHELVGRMDAKRHRDDGLLEVKVLYFEKGRASDSSLVERVALGIMNFMQFQGCSRVKIGATHPRTAKRAMMRHLEF